MISISNYWPYVVLIGGGIAACLAFLNNLLTTRKLLFELKEKYENSSNKVHLPNVEEIKKYGNKYQKNNSLLGITLVFLFAGLVFAVTGQYKTDQSEDYALLVVNEKGININETIISSLTTIEIFVEKLEGDHLSEKDKGLLNDAIDSLIHLKRGLIDEKFGKGKFDWFQKWFVVRESLPRTFTEELGNKEKEEFYKILEFSTGALNHE